MKMGGRWFFGTTGVSRLAELRAELDNQDLVMSRCQNSTRYSPWMSSSIIRDRRLELPVLPSWAVQSDIGVNLLTDPIALAELQTILTQEGETGLESIGTEAERQFSIAFPSSDCFDASRIYLFEALQLIQSSSDEFHRLVLSLCQQILPLCSTNHSLPRKKAGQGFSSHLFRGGVFLDPPNIDVFIVEELAVNLAHELGHQALFVYQSTDHIIEGDLRAPVYSVIRRVDRPAIQSMHATVAAGFMARFIEALLESNGEDCQRTAYLEGRLEENRTLVKQGLAALSHLSFSKLGRALCLELQEISCAE